jgi:hypothetical protein
MTPRITRKNPLRGGISPQDALAEDPLPPEWIKEINGRIRDLENPIRYMLVSEFSRKFILYYDVSADTFAMNKPSGGTLFKQREVAEKVRALLGKGVAVVKFTTAGCALTRLSPYRGLLDRRNKKQGK